MRRNRLPSLVCERMYYVEIETISENENFIM